jgi:protein-S-isoprenylcysteine O-methyltransferase Ste14
MNEFLNTVAYLAAVSIVATLPAAILYWLLIHPFAAFWRRLGKGASFTIVGLICLALAIALGMQHERLLAVHWGHRLPLMVIGFILYALAAWGEQQIRKTLKFRTLVGVPELSNDDDRKLLTDGIYAHSRNPRYVNIVIATIGLALILNYPAVYLTTILLVPGLFVVVLLEEQEMRAHFGEPYERYCREVPRFLPGLQRGAQKPE